MMSTTCRIDDHTRCIRAFELILAGGNSYYKDRLQDPEFVTLVTRAMEAEKAELEECIGKKNALKGEYMEYSKELAKEICDEMGIQWDDLATEPTINDVPLADKLLTGWMFSSKETVD